jgi:hypothetical protein
MATKVYRLNQPKNTATFQLHTNHGRMTIGYEFKGGNQTTKVPATCTLKNEFHQQLLESSDLFKNGIIKLERVLNADAKPVAKKESKKVDEITSPEQAIEYVFNNWGIVVKSGKQAAKIANQKGVEFPNLKEKTNDK